MTDVGLLERFLAGAHVDAAVFALRPDYRALLLAVDGLSPARATRTSDALLQAAEAAARQALERAAGGAAPARGGVARGLPGVRGQAATHPQQPGGSAAPGGVGAAAREPAHRPLQRGLGAATSSRSAGRT